MNTSFKKWTKIAQLVRAGRRYGLYRSYPFRTNFRNYSTKYPGALYELRSYRIKPSEYKRTFALCKDYINLRNKHSKLIGFWMVEVGDNLMQLLHMWEYEDLAQRYRVRKSMMTDAPWQTEFVPNFLEWAKALSNNMMILAPNTKLKYEFPENDLTRSKKIVYELQTMKRENLKGEIKSSDDVTLAGRFFGVLGPTDIEYRLWRYADIRTASDVICNRVLDKPVQGTSVLLYPAIFSPMQ